MSNYIEFSDPLDRFDWTRLFVRYDLMCKGFSAEAEYLTGLDIRLETDRTLYEHLIGRCQNERSRNELSIETYEAIMYWKLYSQPAAVANICRKIRHDHACRSQVIAGLARLGKTFPKLLERDTDKIEQLVESIGRLNLPGMKTHPSLPVRTTLLHFIYPETVPIFDKMVLRAVGIDQSGANQDLNILRAYIPFAWQLADRYADKFKNWTARATPVRLIDMALWVERGTTLFTSAMP